MPGIYVPSMYYWWSAGFAVDWVVGSNKLMLVTTSYTPDYINHAVRSDVTNEVSGTGYTTGGKAITGSDIFTDTPAVGQLAYLHDNIAWTSATISGAAAGVEYNDSGAGSASDQLMMMYEFDTPISVTAGTLTVETPVDGIFNLLYTA